MPVDHGLLIAQVVPNGPAARAGLQAGDIITVVGARAIATYDDLLAVLATKQPGDVVQVTAYTPRGGKRVYQVAPGELAIGTNG